MISKALEDVLRAGRDQFNAQFADAKRAHPQLNGDEFTVHLMGSVNAIVDACNAFAPDKTASVTQAAYGLSLELMGQDLLGSRSKLRAIEDGWRTLLPSLAPWMAQEPARVLGSISNALFNMARTPGARTSEWIERMQGFAAMMLRAQAQDSLKPISTGTMLALGQVAAWQSGMAHYRAGALALLNTFPPKLAEVVLGTKGAPMLMKDVLARMKNDRWWNPIGNVPHAQAIRLVRTVGAFRGYGGEFMEPPTVQVFGDGFLVRSGVDQWQMCADAFGATLHRVSDATGASNVVPWSISKDGLIKKQTMAARFDVLMNYSSAAGNESTLAVTSPLSHSIFLFGVR